MFFRTSLGNLALERSSVVDRILVTTLASTNWFRVLQKVTRLAAQRSIQINILSHLMLASVLIALISCPYIFSYFDIL